VQTAPQFMTSACNNQRDLVGKKTLAQVKVLSQAG